MQKREIDVLILDSDREEEAKTLIESLENLGNFNKNIIYLDNGSGKSYPKDFLENGRIDILLRNSENLGCGIGTRQLFSSSSNKYCFYIQVDQFLQVEISENIISRLIKTLEENDFFHIDLAGNQGNGRYSERAQFLKASNWLNIPNMTIGGPGPYHHIKHTEQKVQEYFEKTNQKWTSTNPALFANNGCWSIRKNPDGSVWKHRTDTKEQWLISGPVKEKYIWPKFSTKEWEEVLQSQKWEDGKIPEQEKPHSFKFWP